MQIAAPELDSLNSYDTAGFSQDSSHAYIVQLCPEGKHILEVGAGSGIISKSIIDVKGGMATAVDVNPSAMLRSRISSVFQADLNDQNWINILNPEIKFDVIIAADVLEHLYDPWRTLRQLKGLLNKDGIILLSLPHVSHAGILAALLNEDFCYREWGLLDKTHIRFFSLKNIAALHKSVGLKITDVKTVCKIPEETELSEFWRELSYKQKRAIGENRNSLIYQIIIKSEIACQGDETTIDLLNLPIQIDYPKYLSEFQKIILKKMSEFICTSAKILSLFGRVKYLVLLTEKLKSLGNLLYQKSK